MFPMHYALLATATPSGGTQFLAVFLLVVVVIWLFLTVLLAVLIRKHRRLNSEVTRKLTGAYAEMHKRQDYLAKLRDETHEANRLMSERTAEMRAERERLNAALAAHNVLTQRTPPTEPFKPSVVSAAPQKTPTPTPRNDSVTDPYVMAAAMTFPGPALESSDSPSSDSSSSASCD